MRRGLLGAAGAVGLAGPAVQAFFAGGYFDEPRAWGGLVAWILVVVAIVFDPEALPHRRTAWLAIGALAGYAGWTLLSIGWGPLAGPAYHAGQLVLLYVGALLAASMLLRSGPTGRWAEPALAAGVLVVIGYGLSERFLPGLLHFARSTSAEGRLEQPVTYWNAIGELAAIGFVLCARLVGDFTRTRALRIAAAAASAPLGMGLYLSFSRGALFAGAAGLVALIVLAPRREQLRALLLTVTIGVLASLAAAPFRSVTALIGSPTTAEREGAIALVLLALLACLSALTCRWMIRHEQPGALTLPRRAPLIALVAICAGLAIAIVAGAKERSSRPLSGGASRLGTLQSNRYAYWRVALRAFADEPLRGVGAGGWSVYWLRYRHIEEFAHDAHSLPLQTLAELGIVGFALLLAFLTGIFLAARAALQWAPARAAGPAATAVVYVAHAPLDWDWQMPAVTLIAIILAGMLIALAEDAGSQRAARPVGWQ